ncbi:MAG: ROK family protein [Chloroflexi bacterium]|nr:ROK family protein [Chloroflexota bacterium]MBU1752137.1 ROK family protein [Chloroflexota bacterium]
MSRRSYRTGDQTLVRSMNLSTVLRCIWDDRPLSRTTIAAHTGLNKTTVSSLVTDLEQRGLIHEVGQRESSGGRPARLLDLNADAGVMIGVEIGVDFCRAVLTDFLAAVLWREHCETSPLAGQDDIIQTVLTMIGDAVEHAAGSRILGIGVTLRGLVDTSRGVSVFFPNQWRNVPVRQIISEHFDYPVAVDNDANAAALGERLFGAAGTVDDFIYVVVGMGIGAGICINGQIYRGAGGYAGEVGHTKLLHSNSRPCHCGQRGCWETLANQYALVERVQAALAANHPSLLAGANPLTVERIGEAADAGDPVACQALAETGAFVGIGIANLVNTFNPKLVVVGGAMYNVMSYLLPAIRQQVDECSSSELSQMVSIEPSVHGRDACAIGAVALITQDILHDPTSVPRYKNAVRIPEERG